MQMLMQPSPATEPSPGPGEVDIRPFVSIVGELEAAQSVLDNANYSLANALALDDSPASTPDTNFLEQQLVQAAELERAATLSADPESLQRAFDFHPLGKSPWLSPNDPPPLAEVDLSIPPSPPLPAPSTSPPPSSPPPLPPSASPPAILGEAQAEDVLPVASGEAAEVAWSRAYRPPASRRRRRCRGLHYSPEKRNPPPC